MRRIGVEWRNIFKYICNTTAWYRCEQILDFIVRSSWQLTAISEEPFPIDWDWLEIHLFQIVGFWFESDRKPSSSWHTLSTGKTTVWCSMCDEWWCIDCTEFLEQLIQPGPGPDPYLNYEIVSRDEFEEARSCKTNNYSVEVNTRMCYT